MNAPGRAGRGALEPASRAHAVAEPPPGEWEQRFAGPPTGASCVEAVYEGYLLHYGEPRAFAGMDDDLRLLAGDALYALGLERLAQAGDLEAVAELADLISALRPRRRPRAGRTRWPASGRRAVEPAGAIAPFPA